MQDQETNELLRSLLPSFFSSSVVMPIPIAVRPARVSLPSLSSWSSGLVLPPLPDLSSNDDPQQPTISKLSWSSGGLKKKQSAFSRATKRDRSEMMASSPSSSGDSPSLPPQPKRRRRSSEIDRPLAPASQKLIPMFPHETYEQLHAAIASIKGNVTMAELTAIIKWAATTRTAPPVVLQRTGKVTRMSPSRCSYIFRQLQWMPEESSVTPVIDQTTPPEWAATLE